MAETFLQQKDQTLEVFSAGINPDDQTDPMAIKVMDEIGIDIRNNKPKSFSMFEGMTVDYLITLCDGTKDKLPSVNISYTHKIHLGFNDPRKVTSSGTEKIEIYREIRDEIKNELDYFYNRILVREFIH